MGRPVAKTSTVLGKARLLIEEAGWCRGYLERHGRYCVLGALRAGVGPIDDYRMTQADTATRKAFNGAELLLQDMADERGHPSIVTLNDEGFQSRKQVLAFFDEAIERARRAEWRDAKRRNQRSESHIEPPDPED